MAPPKKKRKMSSTEKQKLAKEGGKKSASKQGKGVGSRKKFSLPAKWREEKQKRGGKTRLQFSSPGKTKYATQKAVKESLEARDMQEFLHENVHNCFSSDGTKSEESEFRPSSEDEQMAKFEVQADKMGEEMEHRLFVCESTQLMEMVQQINETSKCGTANCNGKIKLFWSSCAL